MSGSDGYVSGDGWTRFWLLSLIPVARAGDTEDFARSAAARALAEGLVWTPAAFLPGEGIAWSAVDAGTARVRIEHRGETYSLELRVGVDGRPLSLVIQRWSSENPDHQWRHQPFGATLNGYETFGGYTIATEVEGGNLFGSSDYFPFYRASVNNIRYY